MKPMAIKRTRKAKAKAKAKADAERVALQQRLTTKAAADLADVFAEAANINTAPEAAPEVAQALAAPEVSAPPQHVAPEDSAAPEKGPLSMSRHCVTSRAYCSAKTMAKAAGKSPAERSTAARQAYKEAGQKWDQEHA